MMKLQPRRLLARPRALLFAFLLALLLYWTAFTTQSQRALRWGSIIDLTKSGGKGEPQDEAGSTARIEQEALTDKENRLREQFKAEYEALGKLPDADMIYGGTIAMLSDKNKPFLSESALTPAPEHVEFTLQQPYVFNPYPRYNEPEWSARHAEYVPCVSATGTEVQDISIFKGRLREFSSPGFGGFELVGLDPSICYERETRFSQYGLEETLDMHGKPVQWDKVNWGELQHKCVQRNKARYDPAPPSNRYLSSVYEDLSATKELTDALGEPRMRTGLDEELRRRKASAPEEEDEQPARRDNAETVVKVAPAVAAAAATTKENNNNMMKEQRTAFLLRSYTEKEYTENDKLVMRTLISELNLRSGGEFQVFLFVQVKEDFDIYANNETYNYVIQNWIPEEFWGITVLWNEDLVRKVYRALDEDQTRVHNAQFMSVQLFMQQHREFDYVWNWEMDSRVTGQNYAMLTSLADFARKQPRKGLWERNERYYIPSFHGDFDTTYRASLEAQYANRSIWGAPDLPFVHPVGPRPPVATPEEDDYEWGVGEDADVITVAPIFNPINSNWILGNQVWGYRDDAHPAGLLPRRGTIVTQSRLSRRLLDIMHVENLRGNHVGSEMVAQTTALLHGLKAVYAPMPIFLNRPWSGERLAHWFDNGPNGESGSFGSAFGWGREARFQGLSWYYRAVPPQRLYNNWMGYEDAAIGGDHWEAAHGRACLPALMLHPIKSVEPTEPGFSSDSVLPFG